MAEDALSIRCIRCGADGLVRENVVVAPCRWLIVWGAPLPQGRRRALPLDVVHQQWEGPDWPWRCPRCEPTLDRAQASFPSLPGD